MLVGDLSGGMESTISNWGNRSGELSKAISSLYCLAKKDPTTRVLLDEYKIDKDSFRDLYWLLIRQQFSRHIKGHYIPASTLVFGDTLEYILKVKNNPSLNMDDAKYRVIRYFDRSEIGEIEIDG